MTHDATAPDRSARGPQVDLVADPTLTPLFDGALLGPAMRAAEE